MIPRDNASNRMYLLHKPTGKAVRLGVRLDLNEGWFVDPNLSELISGLFTHALKHAEVHQQDDFVLAMEDSSRAPDAFQDWYYLGTEDDSTSPFTTIELTVPSVAANPREHLQRKVVMDNLRPEGFDVTLPE